MSDIKEKFDLFCKENSLEACEGWEKLLSKDKDYRMDLTNLSKGEVIFKEVKDIEDDN